MEIARAKAAALAKKYDNKAKKAPDLTSDKTSGVNKWGFIIFKTRYNL